MVTRKKPSARKSPLTGKALYEKLLEEEIFKTISQNDSNYPPMQQEVDEKEKDMLKLLVASMPKRFLEFDIPTERTARVPEEGSLPSPEDNAYMLKKLSLASAYSKAIEYEGKAPSPTRGIKKAEAFSRKTYEAIDRINGKSARQELH